MTFWGAMSVLMWVLRAWRPWLMDQTWKLWSSISGSTVLISAMRRSASISSGVYSIKILMHFFVIGKTVTHTKMEKTKVQIGSAISHSGLKKMIVAAMTTPMDMIMSLKAWR